MTPAAVMSSCDSDDYKTYSNSSTPRNHHSFVKCGRFIHLKPRKLVHAVSRKLTRLSKSHQRTRSHSGIVEEGRLDPMEEGDLIVCTHRSNLDEGHEAETVKNCKDKLRSRKQKHGGNDDLHCRTLSQQRQRRKSLFWDSRRRCNEEGEEVGGVIFSFKNQKVKQNQGTAVVMKRNVGETNGEVGKFCPENDTKFGVSPEHSAKRDRGGEVSSLSYDGNYDVCDDNQCIEASLEICGASDVLDYRDELFDSSRRNGKEGISTPISLVSRVSSSPPIKNANGRSSSTDNNRSDTSRNDYSTCCCDESWRDHHLVVDGLLDDEPPLGDSLSSHDISLFEYSSIEVINCVDSNPEANASCFRTIPYDIQPNLTPLCEADDMVVISEDSLSFISARSTPSTPRNKPDEVPPHFSSSHASPAPTPITITNNEGEDLRSAVVVEEGISSCWTMHHVRKAQQHSEQEGEDVEEGGDEVDDEKGKTEVCDKIATGSRSITVKTTTNGQLMSTKEIEKDGEEEILAMKKKVKRRTTLPAKNTERTVSLFKILRHMIGKDLTRTSLPIFLNEPISFLQRLTEDFEYHHLLIEASRKKTSLERLAFVAAFASTPYASSVFRFFKPFNPLLGETYEVHHLGFRMHAEQVSHHPPISAYNVEADGGEYKVWGSCSSKINFLGNTIEATAVGSINLSLRTCDGVERYSWHRPKTAIHNILLGSLWLEWVGLVKVINFTTNEKACMRFWPRETKTDWGWGGRRSAENVVGRLTGEVYDRENEVRFYIGGDWISEIWLEKATKTNSVVATCPVSSPAIERKSSQVNKRYSTSTIPIDVIPNTSTLRMGRRKSSYSAASEGTCSSSSWTLSTSDDYQKTHNTTINSSHSHRNSINYNSNSISTTNTFGVSLPIEERRIVWQVNLCPPENVDYYNMTLLALQLNEISEDYDIDREYPLPRTDSRLRPDQRLYENGYIQEANAVKLELEEEQRQKMKAQGRKAWNPFWFVLDFDNYIEENVWISTGEYWKENWRKRQKGRAMDEGGGAPQSPRQRERN